MGGYNTIMDILCTGVRALVLPVTSNEDTEQTVRAAKLQTFGVLKVLRPEALAPEPLAATILEALRTKPGKVTLKLDGADQSALLVKEFLGNRATFGQSAQTRQEQAECRQSSAARDGN
jgi:predicted glycosyltransferase